MFEPINKDLSSENKQTVGSKCPEAVLSPTIPGIKIIIPVQYLFLLFLLFHSLHNDNKEKRKEMKTLPHIRARHLKNEH